MTKGNKINKLNNMSWSMDDAITVIKAPFPKYLSKRYLRDYMNITLWEEDFSFDDMDDWYIPTSIKLKYYKDNE